MFEGSTRNLKNIGTISSGQITSSSSVQGVQIRAQATSPTMVVNDTNATNTTNQMGYISFQRQGSERGWIGFGSVNNDDFSIRNVDGEVKILSDATITGEITNSPNGYSTDGGRVALSITAVTTGFLFCQ